MKSVRMCRWMEWSVMERLGGEWCSGNGDVMNERREK
jgi:hypothetical protein